MFECNFYIYKQIKLKFYSMQIFFFFFFFGAPKPVAVRLTSACFAFSREGTSLTPSLPPTSTQSGTPAACSSTWPAPSSTCTASTSSTGTSSRRTCWWVHPELPCRSHSRRPRPHSVSLTDRRADNESQEEPTKFPVGKFQPYFTLIIQRLPIHPLCKPRYRNRGGFNQLTLKI